MPEIRIRINGIPTPALPGTTVAAALLNAGIDSFRISVSGEARGPLCGMGICYECRVKIDGELYARSCQIVCRDGMSIETA